MEPSSFIAIFGGIIAILGIAELFLNVSKGKWMNIGFILSLGMAVSCFQFAMTEFDIRTGAYALNIRWEPYAIYYVVMMIPILSYVFLLAQRRFNRSLAIWILLVPFFYKLAVYLIWSVTSAQMYFPLVLFVSALFYDGIYNTLRLRTRYASYYGLIGLVTGFTAVIAWQSPVKMPALDIILSFSYAIVLGTLTLYCSTRFLEKGDFHRA